MQVACMKGSCGTAEAWHFEKPGESIGQGRVSVTVESPEVKVGQK